MAAEQPKSAGSTPTTKPAPATTAAAAAGTPPLKSDRIPPPHATAQTPPVDGKSFYGYLIKKDRTPTELLDALLRAIAKHIVGIFTPPRQVDMLSFPVLLGARCLAHLPPTRSNHLLHGNT